MSLLTVEVFVEDIQPRRGGFDELKITEKI